MRLFLSCQKGPRKCGIFFVPKTTDKLEIYSDYQEEHKAAGRRLIIKRTEKDGTTRNFSCKLNKFQQNWLPCEGESLSITLTCKHFAAAIIENKNTTSVFTDNLQSTPGDE